tara:strand:+ start:9484 stop:9885 length:402 start_codon:yes stop_codon:yes gene_type:complete
MENLSMEKILLLLASMLILAIFFVAGIGKVSSYNSTVEGLLKKPIFKSLPKFVSQLSIIGVIVLEIIAPLVIILAIFNENYKNVAYHSSLGLAGFTLIATLLYHFPPEKIQYYFFMKNIAIVGGLITLALLFK